MQPAETNSCACSALPYNSTMAVLLSCLGPALAPSSRFDGFVYPPILVLGPVGRCHGVRQQNYSLKQAPDEVTPREPAVESCTGARSCPPAPTAKFPNALWPMPHRPGEEGHQRRRTNPRRAKSDGTSPTAKRKSQHHPNPVCAMHVCSPSSGSFI